MKMQFFEVVIEPATPVLAGRWLCLDALLDAVFRIGDPFMDGAVLPLSAHDGRELVPPGAEALARVTSGEAVYLASAGRFERVMPFTRSFIQSCRRDFSGETLPVLSNAGNAMKKVETRQGDAAAILNRRILLAPCPVRWVGHGDPDIVRDLLSRLPGLGGKVNQGYGMISRITVTVREGGAPLDAVVDPESGLLLRPVPEAVADRLGVPAAGTRRRIETTAPPYFREDRTVIARSPVGVFLDGIL